MDNPLGNCAGDADGDNEGREVSHERAESVLTDQDGVWLSRTTVNGCAFSVVATCNYHLKPGERARRGEAERG